MENSIEQINNFKELKKEVDKLKIELAKRDKSITDLRYQNLTLNNLLQQKPEDESDDRVQREICETQLALLNERSKTDELTMEECRKVSEYVKTLNSLRANKEDKEDSTLKYKTPEQLIEELKNEKAQ